MPLAIELAAGRLASLSLADLAARLDRALDLLSGAPETGDDRHSTLRAAIGWSYELLPSDQQRLFRNLAIFPDGFDLATAEASPARWPPRLDPTSAVAHLVDASMLEATLSEVPRYRMLDTLRSFGLDQLTAHQEHEAAMARFVEWARSFARWVDDTALTADEPLANRRLLAELGQPAGRVALRPVGRRPRPDGRSGDLARLARAACATSPRSRAGPSSSPAIRSCSITSAPRPCSAPPPTPAGRASVTWTVLDRWPSGACRWRASRTRSARQRGLMRPRRRPTVRGPLRRSRRAVPRMRADGTPWYEASHVGCSAGGSATGDVSSRPALLNREAAGAASPSLLAFHHYVAGEIDNLDRAWPAGRTPLSGGLAPERAEWRGVRPRPRHGRPRLRPRRLGRQRKQLSEATASSSTTGRGPAAGPSSGPPSATSPICSTSSTTTTAHPCCDAPPTRHPKPPALQPSPPPRPPRLTPKPTSLHGPTAPVVAREQALDAARSAITRQLTTIGN